MITPSLIYYLYTVLAALVDAIRIKKQWGKVDNINHATSWLIAAAGAAIISCIFSLKMDGPYGGIVYYIILSIGLMAIRFAVYDPILNIFRILTGTNPTKRIDYMSEKTTSQTDQHTNRISFWGKRAIAVVVYAAALFAHYKLFVE